MKKPAKYHRNGRLVMQGHDVYADAKNEIAAATIVDALELATGRIPKDEPK